MKRKEHESFYVEMGFRLKQIRQMRKVSQNELAEALGVVTQTIQKYESGEVKMQPEIIDKCSWIFKIPVGYFYGEGHQQKYTRASLMIAAEAMMLPTDEVRKHVYGLLKSINHAAEQDNNS